MRRTRRKLCRVGLFKVSELCERFTLSHEGVLTWTDSPKNNALFRGKPAGFEETQQSGRYSNGVKVSVNGTRIHAEDIAFTIHHGRHPKPDHKIVHVDGNKRNNRPQNLAEIAHSYALPRV